MDDFALVKPKDDPGAEPRLVSRATLERWPDDYVLVDPTGRPLAIEGADVPPPVAGGEVEVTPPVEKTGRKPRGQKVADNPAEPTGDATTPEEN